MASATWANDVPLETAGDRCEPLGTGGVWTKRGPDTARWAFGCPATFRDELGEIMEGDEQLFGVVDR
jgi:hypothetical protein